MENELKAKFDGKAKVIEVKKHQAVNKDKVLLCLNKLLGVTLSEAKGLLIFFTTPRMTVEEEIL